MKRITSDFPSGIDQLVYPTAIHYGRERGINATYKPTHVYEGDITNTDAIASWIEGKLLD
ncbi:hypothetical protein DRW07_05400 [Alteromonas sediminis]|uniref:Uncharacterized protein n=1 Tax=Alteromonas sediminis TaxID=2259342 RepID=A0A3N5Y1F7_9ALTE|nr:hypothetical protein [Alteromonas sediminis]RPJ66980.1 hypothetical protein DRW07_05400 [Alteromonas sediminis]